MALSAAFYIFWDAIFTEKEVWGFNEDYIIGIKYWLLPIEEILFFFVVPYCCVFIYECIRCYFPVLQNAQWGDAALKIIGVFALAMGLFFWTKLYTQSTFIFLAGFLLIFFIFRKGFGEFNGALFLISYLVIIIPFLIVNGFLTALPVVSYNDAENLGFRIYTIPVEDIFYGLLLIFMNIALFERFRKKWL